MSFVNERSVKSVRRARRCCACSQMVNVGEAAISWAGNTDGEFQSAIYHPDCREAEIALNKLNDSFFPEDWMGLCDMERDDHPWLLGEHPTVAARLNITEASIQADREEADACRAAWNRAASVGRNPEGRDAEERLGAQHEHAVPAQQGDAQPLDISEQPQ